MSHCTTAKKQVPYQGKQAPVECSLLIGFHSLINLGLGVSWLVRAARGACLRQLSC